MATATATATANTATAEQVAKWMAQARTVREQFDYCRAAANTANRSLERLSINTIDLTECKDRVEFLNSASWWKDGTFWQVSVVGETGEQINRLLAYKPTAANELRKIVKGMARTNQLLINALENEELAALIVDEFPANTDGTRTTVIELLQKLARVQNTFANEACAVRDVSEFAKAAAGSKPKNR